MVVSLAAKNEVVAAATINDDAIGGSRSIDNVVAEAVEGLAAPGHVSRRRVVIEAVLRSVTEDYQR